MLISILLTASISAKDILPPRQHTMSTLKGTILLTGANGGLGSAIVSQVTSTPDLVNTYYGIYTVREPSSASVLNAILAKYPTHSHETLSFDLKSLASVREFAADINRRITIGQIPPIRVLILNACSLELYKQGLTGDGFNNSFQVNYLSQWLLTLLLLQSMNRTSGRIIFIGSLSHDPNLPQTAWTRQYIRPDGTKWTNFLITSSISSQARNIWPDSQSCIDRATGHRAYGFSKFCLVSMMHELQSRLSTDPLLSNLTVTTVDPGAMATGIIRDLSWKRNLLHALLLRPLFVLLIWVLAHVQEAPTLRSTKRSAGDVLWAAALGGEEDDGKERKATYFNGRKVQDSGAETRDGEKRRIIWWDSLRFAGLKEGDTLLKDWR